MSASREKNKRKEEAALGISKQQVREQEELAKNKKFKRNVIIVVAVVVVIALALAVLTDAIPFFSGKIKDGATAYTAADVEFSAADYNYYYYSIGNEYVAQYSQYLEMLGIDPESEDFYDQEFSDGMTWGDLFAQEAETKMSEVGYLVTEANKAGFTLSEKATQESVEYFDYLSNYASSLGMDIDAYYQSLYGPGVTEAVYHRNVDQAKLAEEYKAYIQEGFTSSYTDEEFESYYEANPKDIDVADYAYFFMSGIKDSSTDETEEEALADAWEDSNEFVQRLKNGEEFSDLCYEYCLEISKTRYEDPTEAYMYEYTYDLAGDDYADWLFDESRKPGDVEIFEGDPAQSFTGYFIVMYLDSYRCDYNTVNYRNILVEVSVDDEETYLESVAEEEDPASYEDYVKEQWETGRQSADTNYEQWQANGGDEQAFIDMVPNTSYDTETSSNEGLNSKATKYDMETEISQWLFSEDRQPGDCEIFETENGYEIIYYCGTDLPQWKVQVGEILMEEDYNEWYAQLSEAYGAAEKKAFGMFYTK